MFYKQLNQYFKRLSIYLLLLFVIAVILILCSMNFHNEEPKLKLNGAMLTSQTKIGKVKKTLELQIRPKPKHRRTIFGLETSGKNILNNRQACSMESAAYMNPDMDVVLLMSFDDSTFRNHLTKTLLSYKNFKIKMLNITEIFHGTAAENWYEKKMVSNSQHLVEHLADAARYALIYKYGGIYMDIDTYILRSLSNLTNFIPISNDVPFVLENYLFGFREPRHPVLEMALSRIWSLYKTTDYFTIGPFYLWKMAEIHCLGKEIPVESVRKYIPEMFKNKCDVKVERVNNSVWNSVSILMPHYNVSPNYIQSLGSSFHLRNHNTKFVPITKSLKSPFVKIMAHSCPKIFSLIFETEIF